MTVHLAELGEPIATGRSATIHRWPDAGAQRALVVKLFAAGYDGELVDAERRASIEADRLGLSGISCHGAVTVDDRHGLLFDELHGESLTREAERTPWRLTACARTLAQVHGRVHRARTDIVDDVRDATVAALDTEPLSFLTAAQRTDAAALIRSLPDGDQVLHMDFHSENVFTHDGTHAVIDWQTALRGDPAADVAMTDLLLRDAELWPGTPALQRLVLQRVRRIVLRSYLAEYLRTTTTTAEDVRAWRPAVVILRMSTLAIASERAAFRRELVELLGGTA